jgi:hypothetical protein
MEGRKEHNREQASGRLSYLDGGAKTSYGMWSSRFPQNISN